MNKPSIEQIKKTLFTTLIERFEPLGYKYVKSEDEIKRTLTDRVEKVFFNFYFYDSTLIVPQLAIENKTISKIYKKCSAWPKEYIKGKENSLGNTFIEIYKLGDYASDNIEDISWTIQREEDVKQIIPQIVKAIEVIAFPYFKNYGSLETIEVVLNDSSAEISKHRWPNPLRFTHGLIAAKILKKSNITELAEKYQTYFEINGIDEQWENDFKNVLEEMTSHNNTYSA